MEIAMGAIGPLVPRLTNLLVGGFTLEKRVRKGIDSLVTELALMHSALCTVAKVPPEKLDKGVKTWAGKVKELSYQMEDIVDTFMVLVPDGGEPANPKNRIKRLLKKTLKLFKKGKELHTISDALEEAVLQAKELAEQRQRYELVNDTSVIPSIDPRVIALYKNVAELIGIEDSRDELINMLIEDDDWLNHPLKTVSIVGSGGLGKTTLAKAVYDKIIVQFDCCAFVSVSQNPDMKTILKDILFELDKHKYANIYNEERKEKHLIDELIEFLDDKRYLIVVDDIWDKKVWEIIKLAFLKKSIGSRLITTTRIVSVSEACCSSNDDIYRMKALSSDVSRRLFYKRVFSHEKECPDELVQVSEDILKKCGGIPLAIITIASLLASNRPRKTKDEWYDLLDSIGCGLMEDDSVEEMRKILLLSYFDLPSYLKPCLIYLSIFPEDHTIMRDQLICRWIAEGLIHTEKGISLYELGESYFNELINRSMIQPMDIDDQERVKSCRVHDMVLDILYSLSSEENFVTLLNCIEPEPHNLQSTVHRLSIHMDFLLETPTINMAKVRSLTVFGRLSSNLEPLVSSSQVLRLLDFNGSIECVGNLLHLRYLRLRSMFGVLLCNKLPMNIGKLQFLQTLDIREAGIEELPSSIVWLRHLMCLYIARDTKLPSGMDNLTSLEMLDKLSVGGFNRDIVKELGHLTKLRVLRLVCRGLDEEEGLDEALVGSLRNLHKMQCLDIAADGMRMDLMREGWVPPSQLRRLKFEGRTGSFLTLPAWVNFKSLPHLSFLEIILDETRAEDVRLLGMLPALRYLYVEGNAGLFQGCSMEMSAVTSDAFPSATECHFLGIAALPSMFPQGTMPKVTRLGFGFPVSWITKGGIDVGMAGHLPSLQSLEVGLLCNGASAREVKDAKVALTAAADEHRNHPAIEFEKW